jgi:hypothetical protein
VEAWLEQAAPAGDQAVGPELEELELGSSSALEEESLHVLAVQIAVLVQSRQHCHVSRRDLERLASIMVRERFRFRSKFQVVVRCDLGGQSRS